MRTENGPDHKKEEDREYPLEVSTQALKDAINNDQTDTIKNWIAAGQVAIDTPIRNHSLLNLAVCCGRLELLTFLCQQGASTRAESLRGHSLFYWALQSTHPQVIVFAAQDKFLTQYQEEDKHFTQAHLLAARPDEKALEDYLIAHPDEKDKPTKEGYTPLHIATLAEHSKNIETLSTLSLMVSETASSSSPLFDSVLWKPLEEVFPDIGQGVFSPGSPNDPATPGTQPKKVSFAKSAPMRVRLRKISHLTSERRNERKMNVIP